MYRKMSLSILALAALVSFGSSTSLKAQPTEMTFFVTSVGPGDGANLGGLAGADQHCQNLASAAGAGHRTWRAYLSAVGVGTAQCVNARNRIGNGPWLNAKAVIIAENVDQLHAQNNINKETAVTETGAMVNGRGDTAQHARHPDRLDHGRPLLPARQRHDLRQLDPQRRRLRAGRPP